jgi:hypothetical protein
MRRLLIVSPHFPPVNAPDHQRVRMSLPYFHENGWAPTVLAVEAARVEAPQDPFLATTVPADIPVHRVSAYHSHWTRRFGLGNLAYRSWFQLQAEGDRLLRDGAFDLVYFSTTQFVATALGSRWRRRYGVPFVVDIQDPWRTDYYERPGAPRPPGGWKYRFARWQAKRLEERAWRDAAGFISVSETYLAQLRARYPWFAAKPSAVIPFGAPEADFALARTLTGLAPAFAREPGCTHIVAIGAVGPIMRASILQLCKSLRAFRDAEPALATRLRFHFIGTSYARADHATASVSPLAVECGVGDLVTESPTRVGYFTALRTLLAADAIVIPGSDDSGYNPSKLATCFLAAKPVLALAPTGSSFEQMVRTLGFASLVPVPGSAEDSIASAFFRAVLRDPAALPPTRATGLFASTHTARACTARQCELFSQALAAAAVSAS